MNSKEIESLPQAPSQKTLEPGLYVVATPIGNLGDFSFRALATLRDVDLILAEDTRVTKVLLERYKITTPLLSFHAHNENNILEKILNLLREGKRLALFSDAGTPLISDPGFRLTHEVLAQGFFVKPIPGASAVLAALMASGLPTDKFFFAGFLSSKTAQRRRQIHDLREIPGTLVFFETARRLAESLTDFATLFPERTAVVAREMTKKFETFRRGSLAELCIAYRDAPNVKGECVLLLAPMAQEPETTSLDAEAEALLATLSERLGVREIVAGLAQLRTCSKRQIYARAVALTRDKKLHENDLNDATR